MVKPSNQLAKDYIWNTLGSLMNAASSVLMLLVVTRVLGPFQGGVFSLAYALAQQFQTVGAFEMRPYQATDVGMKYSFASYVFSRILTTFAMLACVLGYSLVTNGFSSDAFLIFLIAFLKVFDVVEDVFHGELQRRGRLDIAGRAFFFRLLITILSFSAVVIAVNDMMAACLVCIPLSIVGFLALNIPFSKGFLSSMPRNWIRQAFSLLKSCFPLFLGAFLATYLSNAPRFGIEECFSKDFQTYYSVLFMPSLAINLLSQLAFRPMLTTLADSWIKRDGMGFARIISKSIGVIFVLFFLICLVAYPFGTDFLGWLYDIDLSQYRFELMLLLFGGVMNAVGIILYYALVTMRRQSFILVGYLLSAALVFLLGGFLVSEYGMTGAALLYIAGMTILAIYLTMILLIFFTREAKADSRLLDD